MTAPIFVASAFQKAPLSPLGQTRLAHSRGRPSQRNISRPFPVYPLIRFLGLHRQHSEPGKTSSDNMITSDDPSFDPRFGHWLKLARLFTYSKVMPQRAARTAERLFSCFSSSACFPPSMTLRCLVRLEHTRAAEARRKANPRQAGGGYRRSAIYMASGRIQRFLQGALNHEHDKRKIGRKKCFFRVT